MLKSDLQPPRDGLNADPVLYGIAAGLAQLFPPVEWPDPMRASDREPQLGEDASDPQDKR